MDPVKILKRSWTILWSYRALWVFGLVLTLAGAGSQGNSSMDFSGSDSGPQHNQPPPEEMTEAFEEAYQELQTLIEHGPSEVGISNAEWTALLWIAVLFVLFSIALGIIMAIARYVSETAVIRMVDQYEASGTKMTVREGFQAGWSRASWRLFLINLLVNLPVILLMLVLIIIGGIILAITSSGGEAPAAFVIFIAIAVVFLMAFVVAIFSILLGLLRNFFWRVAALEDVGVRDSLRRGFQMAREQWKNVGIMWLVMIGLGIAWAIVSVIAVIVLLPVVLVTTVAAALVVAIPVLLVYGLASLFLSGWLPWAVGILFALPLFFTVAFSPWALLGSWQTVFTSTVWTLVYRELKALPALTNGDAPVVTAM
jgi:hypothetical protein